MRRTGFETPCYPRRLFGSILKFDPAAQVIESELVYQQAPKYK